MIEIKAKATLDKADPDGAEIDIENRTEGAAIEVMHESLAIVRAVSATLRKHNPLMHLMFVKEVVRDGSVLFGEDPEPDREETAEKALAELMSKAIIRKGVN